MLRPQQLAAREAQQLGGQPRAAPRGLHRRLAEPFHPRDVAGGAQDHVDAADHHGQQVVEIVRDPAGQLADRLETLALLQPFVRAAAFRHVHDYTAHDARLARAVRVGAAEHGHPSLHAVRPHDAALKGKRRRAARHEDLLHIGPIVGHDVTEERLPRPCDTWVRVAEQPVEARAVRPGAGGDVDRPLSHARRVERQFQPVPDRPECSERRVAGRQRALRPAMQEIDFSQIHREHDRPGRQRLQPATHPAPRASGTAGQREHVVADQQHHRHHEPKRHHNPRSRPHRHAATDTAISVNTITAGADPAAHQERAVRVGPGAVGQPRDEAAARENHHAQQPDRAEHAPQQQAPGQRRGPGVATVGEHIEDRVERRHEMPERPQPGGRLRPRPEHPVPRQGCRGRTAIGEDISPPSGRSRRPAAASRASATAGTPRSAGGR